MTKPKRRFYKKKRYIIFLIVIIALVIFRLFLPTIVKNYVNKTLAGIPGYYGHVEDIDISLYRGAYVINGLYLNKVKAKTQVPFLNFPKTDISVEWSALFHGKIVSEIEMQSPKLTYVLEDQKTETKKEADTDDWTQALTDLVPLDINRFEIFDGKIAFVEVNADPTIDMHISKLHFKMNNLRNVKQIKKTLPSPIEASGVSIGQGKMHLNGKIDIFKEIPDLDLSFGLENADITSLNDFTNHYAGLDFESGKFSVFSEVAIADGHLTGYIKPLMKDTKLIGKGDSFLKVLWEGFVDFFKFILKNHGTNTLATKVPISGDLNNVKTGVWPTVTNIFKNAWIKAFKGEIDEDVNYKDALKEAEKDEKKENEKNQKHGKQKE